MKQFLRFKVCVFLTLLLVTTSLHSFSQDGTQAYKPLVGTGLTVQAVSGGTLTVGSGGFTGLANLTDANLANYAFNAQLLGVNSVDGVSVKSATPFASGMRAGFVVQVDGSLVNLSVLQNLKIATYSNGTEVTSRTGTALNLSVSALSSASSGKLYLNFISTGAFDEVRLTYSSTAGLSTGNFKIYYAMVFSADAGINENNGICEDQIAGPSTSVSFNGGLLSVATSLNNASAINSGNKNSAATLLLPAGTAVLSTPIYVGVTDLVNVFPIGSKAGFVIKGNSSLLSASVLNSLKIETYYFGEAQESVAYNSGSGLINLSALSTNTADKKRIEFTTTKKYNEVRLVFTSGIDVNVATTDIYYAYESGSSCGDCSTGLFDYTPNDATYEGTVVTGSGSTWTGAYGVCIGSGVTGTSNLLTAVQTDFASISAVLGIACGGRITVQSAGSMPAGTFAGFEIAQDNSGALGLLSLSLLNAITVRAYSGSTEVGSLSGASLLGGGILAGVGGKTTVGFRPTASFNRIQIDIDAGLLSVATTYRIYRAFVIRDTDGDGTPDCQDVCAGNDALDSDGDGTPDACDACNNVNLPAPILNATSLSNICPAATANLNSLVASNTPSGATLSFHTATPATVANLVSNAAAVAAPGTYYAVFGQGSGCYGGDGANTTAVTVTANTCLAASDPPVQTAYVGQAKTGNAATELAPTGGVTPYTYSRNTSSCTAPVSGATALPGTITFNPVGGPGYSYTAPATAGTYFYCIQVCDANNVCVTKTYTLQVGALQAPIAEADHLGAIQSGPAVNGNLKTNDKDPQGGALTYNTTPAQAPSHGTVSINADGTYSYTPATGYVGIDSFSYTVCNSFSLCSTQKAYVSVVSTFTGNDAPIAQPDFPFTNVNTTLNSSVAGNDIDPDGGSLTFTLVTAPAHGGLTINPSGTFTYTPTTGYVGTDIAEYQVCDASNLCSTAKIYFTVDANANGNANDAPQAGNDVVKATPGLNVSGNVGANDSDPNGDALTYSIVAGNTSGFALGSNGSFNYTPPSNFTGTIFVTYSVCDGSGGCDTATIAVVSSATYPSDLTIELSLPSNNFAGSITTKQFTADLFEALGYATSSPITFSVYDPVGYQISFDGTISSISVSGEGPASVSNTEWTHTYDAVNKIHKLTSKPGVVMTAYDSKRIGFTLTKQTANPKSVAYLIAQIDADPTKTYDSDNSNNITTKVISVE